MTKKKNSRLFYIDLLNCIAIFGVLVQHTAQIAHVGVSTQTITIIGNVIQTIFLPAVGIFFMNSGAMLLNYRERQNTSHFFKRRLLRVALPFLIWSIFYYIYGYYQYAFPGIFHHTTFGLRDFTEAFVDNKINSLFWFFYIIIQLYVATPVFAILAKKHKDILCYVAVIAFISADVYSYIDHTLHLNLMKSMLTQPLLASSWIQYFIFGYLIKEDYFSRKVENGMIIFGMFTFILNIVNDLTINSYNLLQSISDFPYAVAIYLIIKRCADRYKNNEHVTILMEKLASTSLGIYILHPLFIAGFDWLFFSRSAAHFDSYMQVLKKPVHIFVLPILIYIILVPIILSLKRISFMKYILP